MFDGSCLSLMTDEVTIEPFAAETSARVRTYGAAVTYRAAIVQETERLLKTSGDRAVEVVSKTQVIIPNRVAVDERDRITLPSGFSPQAPQIQGVRQVGGGGLGLDHTVVLL
jgi:hypothetical protein